MLLVIVSFSLRERDFILFYCFGKLAVVLGCLFFEKELKDEWVWRWGGI